MNIVRQFISGQLHFNRIVIIGIVITVLLSVIVDQYFFAYMYSSSSSDLELLKIIAWKGVALSVLIFLVFVTLFISIKNALSLSGEITVLRMLSIGLLLLGVFLCMELVVSINMLRAFGH